MELAVIAFKQTLQMFLILVSGIMLFKIKLIDAEMNKKLSNLLLMFVGPCLIISSYQMELTEELFSGWIQTFTLSAIAFALTIPMTRFLVPRTAGWDTKLERICIIYSNCAFIGLPLLNGLFGKEGVFYMTVFMTVFNIMCWTQGVWLLNGRGDWRSTAKNLCSPMLISVLVGAVMFLLQIKLPEVILSPLESIGAINTPMAMIVAGVSLAQTDIRKLLTKWRVYLISFLKLIICPLLFILVVGWFPWDNWPLMTVFVAAACPVGTTGTLFALRFDRDAVYATELLAISTMLSIATIPLMILLKGALPFVG